MRIVSWNVNGLRAVLKKGFMDWLADNQPDVLGLQETKLQPEQVPEELTEFSESLGYCSYWQSAQKKGYSSVGLLTKHEPLDYELLGDARFDDEGRVQLAHFSDFVLFNCYFPNSQAERARLPYKLDFCAAILERCREIEAQGKSVIVMGDFNIAHKAIDLKNPKNNENNAGYYLEERQWMDLYTEAGYVDAFRHFCQEPDQYTWWSYRAGARARNVGWRIDYHCVSEKFMARVKSAQILPEVMGSDHCPVVLDVQ